MILAGPIRWRRKSSVALLCFLLAVLGVLVYQRGTNLQWPVLKAVDNFKLDIYQFGFHPIDELVRRGDSIFEEWQAKESKNLTAAVAFYKQRRGREPPPKFDEWFAYAQKNKAVIVEDLFDQIYHDLEPFWGIPPAYIRESTGGQEYVISIRNGALVRKNDKRYRVNFWREMLQPIARFLPDVDMPFNIMDEPRLVVPWETINDTIAKAVKVGKEELGPTSRIWWYRNLPDYNADSPKHEWEQEGSYWNAFKETCRPTSFARSRETIDQYTKPPAFPIVLPYGTSEGYVKNWTVATNPCWHPHLRGTHGSFLEPVSKSTSSELFPIFGGSKMPTNNDILVPAPRYWTTETRFTGKTFWSRFSTVDNWNDKTDQVVWRGSASGGRNRAETWTRYHRHRFVSMMNSTQILRTQQGKHEPQNVPLPNNAMPYDIAAKNDSRLVYWVKKWADAGFTDLECFPREDGKQCSYSNHYYRLLDEMPMYKQYSRKYLADIDGNSFSGRYRAFLLSSSLPLKATIYREWHDSRLIPWRHFVPMDNTFIDIYGIMDYFLGYRHNELVRLGHDDVARRIATHGRMWAEQVLRKEDMVIYMYRLMLEYARVTDDAREKMGFST